MSILEAKSTLTNYGNIVGPIQFKGLREKLIIKKFIMFTKKTFKYNQWKETKINDRIFYQIPRGISSEITVSRPELDFAFDEYALKLHDYQEMVVSSVYRDLKKRGHYFLQMDTGLGKSFVAAGLINKIGQRTCVVVHNKILKQQMIDDLNIAFGRQVSISGDKKSKKENILVLVINTAVRLPKEFWQQFGLVIMDEVHSFCCNTTMDIFFKADYARYVFAMTATPKRLDGMESIAVMHLGNWIRAESIYGAAIKASSFFGRVLRVSYTGPKDKTQEMTNSRGIRSTILMAKQLLLDNSRMVMVSEILRELYKMKRYVYVFCQTKSPLKELRALLLQYDKEGLTKDDIFIVTGDSKKDEIKVAKSNAKIFLTTYTLSSKGLSVIRFDTLLFLTPMKSNMEQIVGRIFRKNSDESIERLVIDIVDMGTFLKKQWAHRNREYKMRNMPNENCDVHYSNSDYKDLLSLVRSGTKDENKKDETEMDLENLENLEDLEDEEIEEDDLDDLEDLEDDEIEDEV